MLEDPQRSGVDTTGGTMMDGPLSPTPRVGIELDKTQAYVGEKLIRRASSGALAGTIQNTLEGLGVSKPAAGSVGRVIGEYTANKVFDVVVGPFPENPQLQQP